MKKTREKPRLFCPTCSFSTPNGNARVCPEHSETLLVSKEAKQALEYVGGVSTEIRGRLMEGAMIGPPKSKEQKDLERQAMDDAYEKFTSPDLLKLIHEELSKYHLMDDAEKMFVFLMSRTAFLPDASDRKSICLKGDSSVGKDNLVRTILRFTPEGSFLHLTRATQSALEDSIGQFNIIAYSEVNAHREEGGANSELVEIIKQLTEGGSSVIKKDPETGFKSTITTTQEQKTVIYSTTEDETDDEMDTRFVMLTVKGEPAKIAKINSNTLSSATKLPEQNNTGLKNWLVLGQEGLKPLPVIFPHLEALENNPEKYFDCSKPRSTRDLKRLVALAKAIAWLHQAQRPIYSIKGQDVIIGHPDDLINALLISSHFFDISYLGLDGRAQAMLDAIRRHTEKTGYVERATLMDDLKLSKSAFYSRLSVLTNSGHVESEKDPESRKHKYSARVQEVSKQWSQISGIISALREYVIDDWVKRRTDSDTSRMVLGHLLDTYNIYKITSVEDSIVSRILREHTARPAFATFPSQETLHTQYPPGNQDTSLSNQESPPKSNPPNDSNEITILPTEKPKGGPES